MVWSNACCSSSEAVITHHRIKIGRRTLTYTAEAGRTPIRDVATGEPLGYLFYVAYRVPSPPGTDRPISFIWNGGPGWPSATIQFYGGAPKRIQGSGLVTNADTWLTDSDLVYMDAMGTGFSRAVSPEAQKAFTSDIGDLAASTEFVRAWLLDHGAEDAPLIIIGESYGAGRAGSVAYRLLKLGFKVRGLGLFSDTAGMPRYPNEDIIAPAMHVGDYAVAALYYHKLPPDLGTTPDAARATAEQWARKIYIPALMRLGQLSYAKRLQIAAELARHIGIEPIDINLASLKISEGGFLGHLVPGKLPFYLDYRKLQPYHYPSLEPAVRYIRHNLGYGSDLPYLGVESVKEGFAPFGVYPQSVNSTWVYSTVYGATPQEIAGAQIDFAATGIIGATHYGPELSGAAAAMQLYPHLQVLVAHGAYDPVGGCSMDAALDRHLTSPYREDVTFRCYMAGHVIYLDPVARAKLAADVRSLERRAAAAGP
ncbi:MAG: hypothetical protein ACREV7_19355 [Steroidobacteraceae bacterium]